MTKERASTIYFLFIAGIVCITIGLNGCATQSKSMALGGAVGMGAGAAIGGIADAGENGRYRTRNVIIGSALGGVAGLVTGAAIHGSVEEQTKEAEAKGKREATPQNPDDPPTLNEAKYESRFIKGRRVGNTYIGPHWEYRIIEPAQWRE